MKSSSSTSPGGAGRAASARERIDNYYSASCNSNTRYPPLDAEIDCEVIIVGGGMTGVASALELAERGSRVALLEANRIGWGATGRNGGQITGSLSGDRAILRQLSRGLGKQRAEATLRWLRWHGHDIIENRVRRHGIECDLKHGHLLTAWRKKDIPRLEATLEEARAAGLADDVAWLDRAAIHERLATPLYAGGILNRRNLHLHSLNLCLGEAAAAAQLGADLYEQSPVIAIDSPELRLSATGRRGSSRRPTDHVVARTAEGSVRAKHLILAGNAYHKLLPRQLGGLMFPAVLGNLVTRPLGTELARRLNRDDLAVYDSRTVLDYHRLTADRRLMFGGGSNYTAREIPDVAAHLRPALEKTYPDLAGIEIDYAWTGKAGIVPNRIPIIGELAGGVLFAQGYSGHGMASSHILAEVLAEHIHGDSERFSVLSRLRHLRLPVGERLGCAAMALAMQACRWLE